MSSASSSSSVDILICHVWPSAITEFSSVPLPSPSPSTVGATPVDEVVSKIKPRYVFSSGGGRQPCFWEREPFVWNDDNGRVTRFVGLGAFGGEPTGGKKQRVRIMRCRSRTHDANALYCSGSMPFPSHRRPLARPPLHDHQMRLKTRSLMHLSVISSVSTR